MKYPDKKIWEHEEPVHLAFYYDSDKWKWFKVEDLNDIKGPPEPDPVIEPSLMYLIPYIFKNRRFEPLHVSLDIYPGFTSLCTLKDENGTISAATPSLFLDSEPSIMLKETFLDCWYNSEDAKRRIEIWDKSKAPYKYFLNIISEYEPILIYTGLGDTEHPNLIIRFKAACWTNLKSYLSGAVRFGHGLKKSPGHRQYVLYENIPWMISTNDDYNISEIKNLLKPIKPSENVLKDISSVCENDKKSSIGIIGEPSSGKEIIKDIIRFGKSHKYDFQKYLGLSAGGMAAKNILKQLFGAVSTRGLTEGIIDKIDDGCLFIDEIGKGEKDIRSGLLRILESGEYNSIGGTKPSKIRNLLFIFASTKEDTQPDGKGYEPKDFWTRIEPFIKPVNIVKDEHNGRKNVTLKLWIDIVESMIGDYFDDVNNDILNPETEYEKLDTRIAKNIYEKWIGKITLNDNDEILYDPGENLKNKFNDILQMTKDDKTPREIRNQLGSFYNKTVVREN